MTTKPASGRGWAYTGAVLGGLVSICANVAHSFVPPAGAPAHWTPQTGAVVGAIVWPVFLFIAIEILTSTRWPHSAGFNIVRWGGLLPVTLVAAFVSYRHLSGLLAFYGEDSLVVHFGPLAVDGLMAMATGALIATGDRYTTRSATTAGSTTPALPPTNADAVPVNQSTGPQPVTVPAPPRAPRATPVKKTTPAAKKTAAKKAPAKKATTASRTAPAPAVTAVASDPIELATPPAERHDSVSPAPASTSAPVTSDLRATVVSAAALESPVPAGLLARARGVIDAYEQATDTPLTPNVLAVQMHVDTSLAKAILTALDHPAGRTTVRAVNGNPVHTGQA